MLVEAAHWDATSMFRTGRRHKITSEAGKRNERGVDPTVTEAAADRVVELLVAHGGATAEPGVTVVGAPPTAAPIEMAADLPARITGLTVDAATAVADLRAVGCDVEERGDVLVAVPPPWRPDLTDPHDLVEEVARVVGYDQVPSVLPTPPSGRGLTREQRLRRRVGRTLAGAGFVEVVSFPFLGDADLDKLGLPADDARRTTVRLANPLSAEKPAYTTTLLPGLLRPRPRNLGRGADGVALFETGQVAIPVDGGPAPIYGVDRRPTTPSCHPARRGARAAAAPRRRARRRAGARRLVGRRAARPSWSDAVGAVTDLAAELGVPVEVARRPRHALAPRAAAPRSCSATSRRPRRRAAPARSAGPGACRRAPPPPRSTSTPCSRPRRDVVAGPEFSTMPVAKEDVALLVDAAVPAADVEAALRAGAGDLLESVRLFDVYTGPQVGEGRRSLAFALRFRAPDRTLTEEETGAARDAAVASAGERCGAVQR